MLDEEKYQLALEYATKKHEGQMRKGGEPYIIHPIAVAEYAKEWGYDINYQITGLFHDLLEDTDATDEEILALSNEKVLEAVKLLTKTKGYVMKDYVGAIKANDIARVIKTADRLHNLKSAIVTSDDFKKRYILETVDWYFDLSQEIREVTRQLAKTLKEPLAEVDLSYEIVSPEEWNNK